MYSTSTVYKDGTKVSRKYIAHTVYTHAVLYCRAVSIYILHIQYTSVFMQYL